MALDQENVQKNLDARMKLMGFEVKNITIAVALGGLVNALLGDSLLGTLLTILTPVVLLLVLRRIDQKKPEGYLFHLLSHYTSPKFFSAGEIDAKLEQAIYKESKK